MNAIRNSVLLIGNLGETPELKKIENGTSMTKFSLATNEVYYSKSGEKTEDTQWHNIIAWGKTAETITTYLKKGEKIALRGKLTHQKYDGKDGTTKYYTQVVVNEFEMFGSRDSK